MGIMSCIKSGCDNIMCDCYVPSVGYICILCQSEFYRHIQENNIILTTEEGLVSELKQFVQNKKPVNPHPIPKTIDIEAFFEKHTRGPIFRS